MPTLIFFGGSSPKYGSHGRHKSLILRELRIFVTTPWRIFVHSPPLEEIEDLVRKIVEAEGMELVELEFKTGKSRDLLRIFIDKTGGVTLDDCEKVSQQVGTVLDVKDIMRQAYVLEVSSPGIDRPFKTERDFQRSLGRTIKVHFGEGESPAVGKLLEVQPNQIVMEDNGKVRRITLEQIKKAHQEIVFGQPKKNLNQRRRK